jgi:hypothetical protein
MKYRNAKQVQLRGGIWGRGRVNGEGKGSEYG